MFKTIKLFFESKLGIACLLSVLMSIEASAQIASDGSTTEANVTTSGFQQNVSIASDSTSNRVIVWESADQDGDGYGIYAQNYDGSNAISKSEYLVNTTTSNDQRFPDMAMAPNGDYVITWISYDQDGDGWGVYVQLYDSLFASVGSETLVNTTTAGQQRFPKVDMANDGSFVVTWDSGGDIYFRQFDNTGSPLDTEQQVLAVESQVEGYPDIALAADNSFVITWQYYRTDGNEYDIRAAKYNSSGVKQHDYQVNATTAHHQLEPSISRDTDGNMVIAWASNDQDGDGFGIYFQRFNSNGSAQNSQNRANSTTSMDQMHPATTMTDDGVFVIAWTGYEGAGNESGVYLQAYEADGTAAGDETVVRTSDGTYYQFPALSVYSLAEPLNIAWQGGDILSGTDASSSDFDVVIQSYDLSDLSSALPVELLSFSATEINGEAHLAWSTVSEVTNEGFEILHSTDANKWKSIGFVEGMGNSEMIHSYKFIHASPSDGTNYYQLRQIDYDGITSFSDVERVFIASVQHVVMFPNPATDIVKFAMPYQQADMAIRNTNGQLVMQFTGYQSGQSINISELPSGIYTVTLNEGTVTENFKLLKR